MAAGESHDSSCLKISWFLRSFLVLFLYDFRAASKMLSILEDAEGVVAGIWRIGTGVESRLIMMRVPDQQFGGWRENASLLSMDASGYRR